MEKSGLRRRPLAQGHVAGLKSPQANMNNRRIVPSSYFSAQSLMVLFCLTASLLILPLILPPLPPPPLMLLVLPIGIFLVLLILAFMPSDVRNIASSYL
ncbi:hypothetical protein KFK09_014280 [Dendrobium nobile]|uniref:ARGOS-like protein n=1 Tax=Dendrobium nobile TaxID=94219 RepID=A0A8T3BCI0_DENNO|nr:hypothetical protein KFK09_014280 [Dendrobium nobile]